MTAGRAGELRSAECGIEGTEEEQGSGGEENKGAKTQGQRREQDGGRGIRLWLRSGIPYLRMAREDAEGRGAGAASVKGPGGRPRGRPPSPSMLGWSSRHAAVAATRSSCDIAARRWTSAMLRSSPLATRSPYSVSAL